MSDELQPERRHLKRDRRGYLCPLGFEEDAFIRRLDPDYLEMVQDVRDVKGRLVTLEKSNFRQERYLVGGLSDDGSSYITGVRDRVEEVLRTTRWFWVGAYGIWTIAAGVGIELVLRYAVHLK